MIIGHFSIFKAAVTSAIRKATPFLTRSKHSGFLWQPPYFLFHCCKSVLSLNYFDKETPAAWAVKFTEINSLPHSKLGFPLLNNHCFRAADTARFKVGCGVSFHMPVYREIRINFGQSQKQVGFDVWIRVFIDGNG